MEEKRAIDLYGAAALVGFAALLAFNQVVIKVTSDGFSPVFQAALRSVIASLFLFCWLGVTGKRVSLPRAALPWGIVSGLLFAFEFLCLFIALDLTTVARASIIFYTMPVWLAIAANFLLPGEKLRAVHVLGMAFAIGGVVLALSDRSNGEASLAGDILALVGTFGWAGIALVVRATPLQNVAPEGQLLFQTVVSAPILLIAAPFFGPLIRDLGPVHWAGLLFGAIAVVGIAYLFWFGLLKIYRASSVASFSFLSPVLAVFFGWALLGEHIGPAVLVALALVALGITLINRK